MKATKPQEPKQPKTIAVREVVPWLIVTIMTFAIAGTITGWFIHANIANDKETAVALASKG